MVEPLRIGVVGAGGRMGQMILRQIAETPGCAVGGATEGPGHPMLGRDAGLVAGLAELGIAIGDDPAPMIARVDAVIDFTVPAATAEHARLCAQAGAALVCGTTGLSGAQEEAVSKAARHVPVVRASNFSVGVTLLMALVEQAAGILGPDYDIEVLEMHHKHKVDAPSGTAISLGEAAARGRAVDLAQVRQAVRDGHTGARRAGDIGFATLRGGDVVGDHTVIFAGTGERVELGHKASSRAVFAAGAVRAAAWTRGRPAGLYGMRDVLGFNG
ncbi:MAG: 4-hydroxy-tetrahydrodipicolinate reductase [Alphaproteobacteria bacterium]